MIFAAFRAMAVHAAQLRAALTPRTIAEAADEHWAHATRTRDGADRLADKEAEQEVSEPQCGPNNFDPELRDAWQRWIDNGAQREPPLTADELVAVRQLIEERFPGIDVYPPSNPSNQSSCVDGEAATVVGPTAQGSPAASVSADPDAAGLPTCLSERHHRPAIHVRCSRPTGHDGMHAHVDIFWHDDSSAAPVSNGTPDAAAENGTALSDSAHPGSAGPPELAPWDLFDAARAARELAKTEADGWADLADRLRAASDALK